MLAILLDASLLLSGTEAALASKGDASGSEEVSVGKDVQGLKGKGDEEEASDQDRRVKEVEEQATLGLEEEEEEAERRMGSKREEVRGRDLRRGREGERVKAELCMLEDLNQKRNGGGWGEQKVLLPFSNTKAQPSKPPPDHDAGLATR